MCKVTVHDVFEWTICPIEFFYVCNQHFLLSLKDSHLSQPYTKPMVAYIKIHLSICGQWSRDRLTLCSIFFSLKKFCMTFDLIAASLSVDISEGGSPIFFKISLIPSKTLSIFFDLIGTAHKNLECTSTAVKIILYPLLTCENFLLLTSTRSISTRSLVPYGG